MLYQIKKYNKIREMFEMTCFDEKDYPNKSPQSVYYKALGHYEDCIAEAEALHRILASDKTRKNCTDAELACFYDNAVSCIEFLECYDDHATITRKSFD